LFLENMRLVLKISVITVCYNSSKTIGKTLESVEGQSYPHLEHIIIDGASVDSTLDIIMSHNFENRTVSSESDRGIYDAMNKGAGLATGEVICFLNSDDVFSDSAVIENIARAFKSNIPEIVYGEIVYLDIKSHKQTRVWASGMYSIAKLKMGWHPPHPAFFMRREAFLAVGGFNLKMKIAADYDLMIRSLLRAAPEKILYAPIQCVKMLEGGASNNSFKNIFKGNVECAKSAIANFGIIFGAMAPVGRHVFKLKQHLFRAFKKLNITE
jgi:glycosyltransferase